MERKQIREHEVAFCGDVKSWLDALFAAHSDWPFSHAKIEQYGTGSNKRSDLRVFRKGSSTPVLAGEVKLPGTPEGRSPYDPALMQDAFNKADNIQAPYFLTRNVNTFVLFDRSKWNAPMIHAYPRSPVKYQFQSTPPARGATSNSARGMPLSRFQSTPPARGATTSPWVIRRGPTFQSTPRARGATRSRGFFGRAWEVSIHAPRAGGDVALPLCCPSVVSFNPRPPRGGRRRRAALGARASRFQSTPPARGATGGCFFERMCMGFQSTPPARGATVGLQVITGQRLAQAFAGTYLHGSLFSTRLDSNGSKYHPYQ